MMTFEMFVNEIERGVADVLGSEYDVEIREVPKNNGVVLTGLMIGRKGRCVTTAIYLDSLYESYRTGSSGRNLEEMVKLIAADYREPQEAARLYSELSELLDYEKIREKIIFRLINTEKNKDLLNRVPNRSFHDLSIVFMVFIEEAEDGIRTALINNKHMAFWDVTEDDLYTEAAKNTPRLLPETCMGMDEVIQELGLEDGQDCRILSGLLENEKPPFYVLTNRLGIGGAACLLYPDVLKRCAEKIGCDLLILPSSVHETLLMAYDETVRADEMRDLVRSVNASEVPREDRLSGQVYLYDHLNDRIVVAA